LKEKIALIGLSTGGPSHITKILSSIKRLNAHIIIAQHLKAELINLFAKDLNSSYPFDVSTTPTFLNNEDKKVVICGQNASFSEAGRDFIKIESISTQFRFVPDIDTLFASATLLCKFYDVYAAILTGIGDDGLKGIRALKKHGVTVIAESKESAPVYGMPRHIIENNLADRVLDIDSIIEFFCEEGLIDV